MSTYYCGLADLGFWGRHLGTPRLGNPCSKLYPVPGAEKAVGIPSGIVPVPERRDCVRAVTAVRQRAITCWEL